MFPTFNCDDNSFLKTPHFPSDHQNPNPPFPFNFPSPFLDEHESPLSQIFLQNMPVNLDSQMNHPNVSDHKKDADNSKSQDQLPTRAAAPLRRRSQLGVVPRRRTGKKDRHSKICTAQGVRDRRMRLSLQVARKFFDLQDMLGYDKASKTIEWLFTKSKKAIKDLMINDIPQGNNNISLSDAKSESFLSECEVVSALEEHTKESMESAIAPPAQTQIAGKSNVKESREKARARARSRTREKMMVKGLEHSEQWCKPNPTEIGDFQKLGFPKSVDQESKSCVSPYEASCNSLDQYPLADVSSIERFLSSSSSSWGSSMLYVAPATAGVSDPSCSFMGFFGSWDSLNSERKLDLFGNK